MSIRQQLMLMELADALQALAGALIDLQPPETQDQLADIQIRMLELKKALSDET